MKAIIWFVIAVFVVGFVGSAAAIMGACLAAHSDDALCKLYRWIRDRFRRGGAGRLSSAVSAAGVRGFDSAGFTPVSDSTGTIRFVIR